MIATEATTQDKAQDKVVIELSQEEAELFKKFCKYYKPFKVLAEHGFFETSRASITSHFDSNRTIQVLQRYQNGNNEILYSLSQFKR